MFEFKLRYDMVTLDKLEVIFERMLCGFFFTRSMEIWKYFEKIVRNSIMKFGRINISYDRLSKYVRFIKLKFCNKI